MNWQPIETAPRDGTYVLYWSVKNGFFAGNCPPDCAAGRWVLRTKGTWAGSWGGSFEGAAKHATHWMPLPEPPKFGVSQ